VTAAQARDRCQDLLVLVPHHDEHVVEAGLRDLPDRARDDRLAAERQQELLRSHSTGRAGREDTP
jgi:hypothetical protein